MLLKSKYLSYIQVTLYLSFYYKSKKRIKSDYKREKNVEICNFLEDYAMKITWKLYIKDI